MLPFKDQDHYSGHLDRMWQWQVTVLWVATLPAFVNQLPGPLCQVSLHPLLFLPVLEAELTFRNFFSQQTKLT